MKTIPKINAIYVTDSQLKEKNTIANSSTYINSRAIFDWVSSAYPISHTHEHWEFLIIAEGKVKHTVNGESKILTRGDAVLLRPMDVHRIDYADNSDKKVLHLSLAFANSLCESFFNTHGDYNEYLTRKTPLYFHVKNDEIEDLIEKTSRIHGYDADAYEKNVMILANMLLLGFLEYELNNTTSYPDWLNAFLLVLNSPAHFDKTVQELALLTPYSHSGLSRVFKQYMGVSIIEYVNRIKMLHAKYLLLNTNSNMLEISINLGYDSVSTFNHNFKKAFGIPPTKYRNNHFLSTF